MGYLHYGQSDYVVEIDDRALAHLKVVILTELRAGHALAFSFARGREQGEGRETLWIHPSADLRFQFFGNRAPKLNKEWLQLMMEANKSGTGLFIMDEPEEMAVVVAV